MKKNFFLSLLITLVVGFTACNNVDEPQKPDNTVKLPYSETFATNIGKFTEQSVTGTQKWTADSKGYMKMSGHVSATEKHANEDWLISPKIDLIGVAAAKMTFDYNVSFFKDLATEATIWVSDNYTEGLPATATWQKLTVNLKSLGNWDIISSDEISLTPYAGKKINIAFKYISTATDAGTWEIKNFMVQEGEAEVSTVGGDTEATALTVAEAIANQNSEVKWVKGYVVGVVVNGVTEFTSAADANFTAPFNSSTNVFIADSPTETDYTKCLSVKLNDTNAPENLRSAVNLLDNPNNKGKLLTVQGTLRSMFTNLKGIRDILAFNMEGYTPPTGDFAVPEISIADVRAQWTGAAKPLTDKKKVVGVVVTDLVGGNSGSLRNLTIAATDNSTGIMVRFAANHSFNLGDKIEINIENVELNHYGLALQLNNVPLVKAQKTGTLTITPKVTTIADVIANYDKYESTVVTVKGTAASGGGGTWYSGTASGQNNPIVDGTNQLIAYVTKYAAFKDTAVPTGEKSYTGIVGQYSTDTQKTYQLIIRNLNDIK